MIVISGVKVENIHEKKTKLNWIESVLKQGRSNAKAAKKQFRSEKDAGQELTRSRTETV